tara:strand:- start:383 stop:1474 length:1092 start_codon:yes stop_codon:yes gene_type:complete
LDGASLIKSTDIGSLPFEGDFPRFNNSANTYAPGSDNFLFFQETVVQSFIDKLKAGVDVPTYPQFRDMCKMLLDNLDGIVKIEDGYAVTGKLNPKFKGIPEVSAINANEKTICESIGRKYMQRVCITGPYTLLSQIIQPSLDELSKLTDALKEVVRGCIHQSKLSNVELIVIEEPILGIVDDSRLDYLSRWREDILKSWDTLFHIPKTKGIKCGLHLHSTTNKIFWDSQYLDIIETEVDDPLFTSDETLTLLNKHDKFLKASICKTNVNLLVKNLAQKTDEYVKLSESERLGQIWIDLKKGRIDPTKIIESPELMNQRLRNAVDRFGEERIIYAGPECGLKGMPNYKSAIACLERSSKVVTDL